MAANAGRGVKDITIDYMVNAPKNVVFVYSDDMERIKKKTAYHDILVPSERLIAIPTKRNSHVDESSYFFDRKDEISAVRRSFEKIRQMDSDGRRILFLPDITGEESQLPTRSPVIYGMIVGFIKVIGGTEQ